MCDRDAEGGCTRQGLLSDLSNLAREHNELALQARVQVCEAVPVEDWEWKCVYHLVDPYLMQNIINHS